MSGISPDLVDQFTNLHDNIDARERKGFGGDVSNKDKSTSETNRKHVYAKIITAYTASDSGRKKRSSK